MKLAYSLPLPSVEDTIRIDVVSCSTLPIMKVHELDPFSVA